MSFFNAISHVISGKAVAAETAIDNSEAGIAGRLEEQKQKVIHFTSEIARLTTSIHEMEADKGEKATLAQQYNDEAGSAVAAKDDASAKSLLEAAAPLEEEVADLQKQIDSATKLRDTMRDQKVQAEKDINTAAQEAKMLQADKAEAQMAHESAAAASEFSSGNNLGNLAAELHKQRVHTEAATAAELEEAHVGQKSDVAAAAAKYSGASTGVEAKLAALKAKAAAQSAPAA